jgi:hypothetical protein
MGNRIMFVAGLAVGYVLGAQAGRERYDQIVKMSQQVAQHPTVQKATQKTQEYGKTAMANAPGYAKSASAQVPKIVGSAKQMASNRMPSKLGGGKGGAGDTDDVGADGQLVYPAEETPARVDPVTGVRYSTGSS